MRRLKAEVDRTGSLAVQLHDNQRIGSPARLRIGFVPLLDAAPLIAARELGFFADEGLNVELDRQIGWGNIRDKLTFGHLDAAHALLGMPLFSVLKKDWFSEPLVAMMNLGTGGNAVTLSKSLVAAGVNSAATLAGYVRRRGQERQVVLAHVFGCSMHHYLLREWLARAGIDPDQTVKLCVLPPPQMAGQMSKGYLDGFCVGEPWNTLAARTGGGVIISPTTDILPNHPEKVLAVTRRWLDRNFDTARRLARAVLRACVFCENSRNHEELSKMISRPPYLDMPPAVVRESLDLGRWNQRPVLSQEGQTDRRMRSFSVRFTVPRMAHSAWMLEQMIRWGHAPHDLNVQEIAAMCIDGNAHREACRELGINMAADEPAAATVGEAI